MPKPRFAYALSWQAKKKAAAVKALEDKGRTKKEAEEAERVARADQNRVHHEASRANKEQKEPSRFPPGKAAHGPMGKAAFLAQQVAAQTAEAVNTRLGARPKPPGF